MSSLSVRPRIVVSQCLEFDACRYNGAMVPEKFVRRLKDYVDFVKVCPEVEIGLGVPRYPIRLIKHNSKERLVQPSTKRDLTQTMKDYSHQFVSTLHEVDGFILKASSPSCGIKDVKLYAKAEGGYSVGKTAGVFAQTVLNQFDGIAIEDEGRLTNFKIREHFLTRIFTFARFRSAAKKVSVAALVDFHSDHKLLFMAYNQKHMRIMGKLLAQPKKIDINHLIAEYFQQLKEVFRRNARFTSHINVLMHALGYFKKELTSKEKEYFLNCLEQYRNERIPLSAVLAVLQAWILKYDKPYLQRQVYFAPYPLELVEITDSGKGRDGRY